MFCKIKSAAIHGVEMKEINVEVDISDGLPSFDMVGLLNSEVKESRERVRTAVKNIGIAIPPKRITVSLSPANVRKMGNFFDLPIAIGILKSLGVVGERDFKDTVIIGELSLDGHVNPIEGVITIVYDGLLKGYRRFIVPKENAKEGCVVEGTMVYGVESLKDAIDLINNDFDRECEKINIEKIIESYVEEIADFADISGHELAKRAAIIAACGMHHMLLVGPPGSGKSMLASRISGIMPKPNIDECIEITKIHSVAGKLNGKPLIIERPFRAPHHTVTEPALIGGGGIPRPGEISLAHKGVLFLDELAEFRNDTIDVLREPLENGKISISRINGVYDFPASFMLVAATNPCKCGYYPDRTRCNCTEYQVKNYLGRISGPILDRIDMCVSMQGINIEELTSENKGMPTDEMKAIIQKGRNMQIKRYKNFQTFNGKIQSKDIKKFCLIDKSANEILNMAYKKLRLSARSYNKVLKVARTIADIDESEMIEKRHIAEALGYRFDSLYK